MLSLKNRILQKWNKRTQLEDIGLALARESMREFILTHYSKSLTHVFLEELIFENQESMALIYNHLNVLPLS